ncbi:RNA polymerase sigma factor (sigma-70 family) [Actinocorallia herbida]|uniref:RNA polymerase sigma factor (Sigma-70 family) n=1 Tax=Actinocorallia herbida TaxID=58109 RepID=A0A3N1D7Z8_9ACTN|nr:sigma-70 family RNA polymerase sigma factor [Actinocorallia herbida]ROO89589.1 RNA polymerase sigma factor (sigma-70 family) [Actinocorallia herbida]
MAAWQGQHEHVPDTPYEDQPLIRALRNRSTDALTLVYDRYGPQLFDYCHAILRDEAYAARVVHDTLLAAEAHIAQLPADARLRGWLYALARRECQRILRGPDRPTRRRPAPEAPDDFATAEERQRHNDARALAHKALSALSGRQREAVDLTVRHGLTDTELAGALAIPPTEAAALAEGSRDDLAEAVAALVGHDRVQLGRLLAVLPVAVAPPNLESRILASALDPGMNDERAAIARRAMPFDSRGWPVEATGRQGHRAPADPDRTMVDRAPRTDRTVVDHGLRAARPGKAAKTDRIPAFVWPTVGAAAVGALIFGLFTIDLSASSTPQVGDTAVVPSSSETAEVLDEDPSERPTKSKKPTSTPSEETEEPDPSPTGAAPAPSSPKPTSSSPKPTQTEVEPGELVVGPGCTIAAEATQCSVTIKAAGGPVEWSAEGYGPITGGGSGVLKSGATRLVTFTVTRAEECVEGEVDIDFSPAGVATVAWLCPAAPDPGDGDDDADPAP